MSDLLTHGVSILLLALLNCSNTVLVRGVYIDAEEPDGQCVIFPVYYIRLFFQKERLKKQKRQMDMEKGGSGGGHNHHLSHHQNSLRQQLLRHNEKSPIIVPMNKLTSSHHTLTVSHHPQQHSNLCANNQTSNSSNNHSSVSASVFPNDEWRSASQPLKERGGEEVEAEGREEAPLATNNNETDCQMKTT